MADTTPPSPSSASTQKSGSLESVSRETTSMFMHVLKLRGNRYPLNYDNVAQWSANASAATSSSTSSGSSSATASETTASTLERAARRIGQRKPIEQSVSTNACVGHSRQLSASSGCSTTSRVSTSLELDSSIPSNRLNELLEIMGKRHVVTHSPVLNEYSTTGSVLAKADHKLSSGTELNGDIHSRITMSPVGHEEAPLSHRLLTSNGPYEHQNIGTEFDRSRKSNRYHLSVEGGEVAASTPTKIDTEGGHLLLQEIPRLVGKNRFSAMTKTLVPHSKIKNPSPGLSESRVITKPPFDKRIVLRPHKDSLNRGQNNVEAEGACSEEQLLKPRKTRSKPPRHTHQSVAVRRSKRLQHRLFHPHNQACLPEQTLSSTNWGDPVSKVVSRHNLFTSSNSSESRTGAAHPDVDSVIAPNIMDQQNVRSTKERHHSSCCTTEEIFNQESSIQRTEVTISLAALDDRTLPSSASTATRNPTANEFAKNSPRLIIRRAKLRNRTPSHRLSENLPSLKKMSWNNSNLISEGIFDLAIEEICPEVKMSLRTKQTLHEYLNVELEKILDKLCRIHMTTYGVFSYWDLDAELRRRKVISSTMGQHGLLLTFADCLSPWQYQEVKGVLIPSDKEWRALLRLGKQL